LKNYSNEQDSLIESRRWSLPWKHSDFEISTKLQKKLTEYDHQKESYIQLDSSKNIMGDSTSDTEEIRLRSNSNNGRHTLTSD